MFLHLRGPISPPLHDRRFAPLFGPPRWRLALKSQADGPRPSATCPIPFSPKNIRGCGPCRFAFFCLLRPWPALEPLSIQTPIASTAQIQSLWRPAHISAPAFLEPLPVHSRRNRYRPRCAIKYGPACAFSRHRPLSSLVYRPRKCIVPIKIQDSPHFLFQRQ
jgi:hypothetical protein